MGKPTPAYVMIYERGNPGALCETHRQNRLYSAALNAFIEIRERVGVLKHER